VPATGDRKTRQHNRSERLLDAAARLFAEHGYSATTVRQISDTIDMHSGSVYYHFPSKHALLLAVYERGVERLAANIDAAVAVHDDAWSRLEAGVGAHLETLLDTSDYARVLFRVLPDDVPEIADKLTALRDRVERRFRALIDPLDLTAETDPKMLRFMLLGAMNWSQVWYSSGGDTPRTIAGKFLALVRRPSEQ
jgi:AcrR family transcriptional regulator